MQRLRRIGALRIPRRVRVVALVLGVAVPVWLLAVGDARDAGIFLAAGACAALGAFAQRK